MSRPLLSWIQLTGALSASARRSVHQRIASHCLWQFCHLLDEIQAVYSTLSDLPQHGHKQWKAYFGRTFDVYTKLWKFQQQHRQKLDELYGLKRWQIGEVASKIGQLYHHYYLRSSELHYLNESFAFFSAIRTRGYYSKASKEERPDLMVKKLRYYARFILVCLLLRKMKLVRELLDEFSHQVEEYTAVYDPEDQSGWDMVVQEIRDFVEGEALLNVLNPDSSTTVLKHRLGPLNSPQLEKFGSGYIQLSEVLIVGNCYEQTRFSELSLDMYRMLQTLERDPLDTLHGSTPSVQNPRVSAMSNLENGLPSSGHKSDEVGSNGCGPTRPHNPHKYLLYKPTFSQFNTVIAAAFKDVSATGAVLLYISADGIRAPTAKYGDEPHLGTAGYDSGGVVTNNRREQEFNVKPKKTNFKEPHCIHPGDIYPYMRKPLFLVVDSDNSGAFRNFPNLFGQPFVCLLSPEVIPESLESSRHRGNIFTLFLHCPLTAFCFVCGLGTVQLKTWDAARGVLDAFLTECYRILIRSRSLDYSYVQFLVDDFLRLLVLRYCFCNIVLRLHRDFSGQSFYPSCARHFRNPRC
ncbi:Protein SCAI [Fasciola gigantica]|uniref:Protein SCAI n=1 Tax=Fasciola gigantica TaxID=46835 RepID=A0A504YF03_FASGI|nr:Protein SCAI [Fasciola gigantica]